MRKAGIVLLAVLAMVLLACAWLLGTASGARAVLGAAGMLTDGALDARGVNGRIAGDLRIERLSFTQDDSRTTLTDIRLGWRPAALLRGMLDVETLHVGHLVADSSGKQDTEPAKLPARIGLPFDMRIDDLRLQSGELRRAGRAAAMLGPLALRLGFDGRRYDLQLQRLSLAAPPGSTEYDASISGTASVEAAQPYAVAGRFSGSGKASVEQRAFAATGTVNLGGSLQQLETVVDLALDKASVNGSLTLHPFSPNPLGRSQLSARGIDLAQVDAQLPATALDLRLAVDENGTGELDAVNAAAGPYDSGKLPLHALRLAFRQESGAVLLDRLSASLGTAKRPAGTLEGQGRVAQDGMRFQLRTEALDLARLDSRARATSLSGEAELTRSGDVQEIRLSLAEPLEGRQRITLDAHAVLSGRMLDLRRAELQAGSGRIDLTGQAALDGDQAFHAHGKVDGFRLRDLGRFPQLPELALNAGFTLRGKRAPRLDADLSYNITDSRLAGQPLSGNGELRLRGEHLEIPRLLLVSGVNRLNAEGELSGGDATLSFALDAPQLGQLGPGFGGAMTASGSARGTLARPRIAVEWSANGARAPGGMRIDSMQGKARLALDRTRALVIENGTAELDASGLHRDKENIARLSARLVLAPQPDAPLDVSLQAEQISTGRLRAERFSATAKGTTAAHAIELALIERGQTWSLRAQGGLSRLDKSPLWKGSILAMEAGGRFSGRLAGAAPLLLSAEQIQLEQFVLDADGGRVAVDLFARNGNGIVTRGRIERLQLAQLLRLAQPAPPVKTDLELAGEWNLRIGETHSGTFVLRRERGDLTVLARAPVTLGLSTLTAGATLSAGRLNVNMLAEGRRLGRVTLDGGTLLGNGGNRMAIAPDAPLSGKASIDVPSLAWIGPLLSPSTTLDGSLKGEVNLNGTADQPRLSGRLGGQALRLALADLGLDLRDGRLDSEFQGNRWVVHSLNFQGAEGRVALSGPVDFSGGAVAARLTLLAERFALLNRSDRRIVVSGTSELAWSGNAGKASGRFTVDSGFIDLGSQNKPRLSDDVVIVGREEKQGTNKTAFDVDITVALGDGAVALKGRGLDARLAGEVRLQGNAGETLQAYGTIQVAKGTYTAYGRELEIEQGALRFRGPLNNPSLDILAMRRGQEVEAGVSIRGTALTPRITLVSEPPLPDADKLSWLVLGRGLASAGDTDVGALQSAAAALLSEGAKAGVQSRIASTFGLDTFSIGTSQDTLQQRIVTIGKQVSSRLYLSYQQGLESAGSVVQVRYALSPKLSLEAEAGSRSAISLFYNIAFD